MNRLCLARGIPLVEAGSTGYLGQVFASGLPVCLFYFWEVNKVLLQVCVIKKGETECYECQEKPAQKVYPICTIRRCIVEFSV